VSREPRGIAVVLALVWPSILAMPLLLATGCMTKGEGRLLRSDLEAQLAAAEKRETQARADLQRQLIKLVEERVQTVLRNSADAGAQVQRATETVAAVQGKLEELRHEFDALSKQFTEYRAQTSTQLEGVGKGGTAQTTPPEDKDSLFDVAYKQLQASKHEDSRRLFRIFLTRFAKDAKAANAQYWLGESYFLEKKYAQAIGEFQKVLDTYPKSTVVPDAMFRNGQSFANLKYCTDARVFLQELMRRYPRSPRVREAKDLLRELGRNARDSRKCSS
jgi:tol-pal system protein YbgF